MDYAWDYPAARNKKIILRVNDFRRPIDVMEIGDLVPFRIAVSSPAAYPGHTLTFPNVRPTVGRALCP